MFSGFGLQYGKACVSRAILPGQTRRTVFRPELSPGFHGGSNHVPEQIEANQERGFHCGERRKVGENTHRDENGFHGRLRHNWRNQLHGVRASGTLKRTFHQLCPREVLRSRGRYLRTRRSITKRRNKEAEATTPRKQTNRASQVLNRRVLQPP